MAGINGSMAHLSDTFFTTAISVYALAAVCYTAEYSFGRKGRIATTSAAPARELVGAGGPPVTETAAPAAPASSRRAGIPISLGCALVEQESGFRNVFGHDLVRRPQIRGGKVTRARYARYKLLRRTGFGMQGVGLTQLTWFAFQDEADRLGGCWKPTYQLRVGFRILAALIFEHGQSEGIARFNGSGDAADRYSHSVRAKQSRWHDRLTK